MEKHSLHRLKDPIFTNDLCDTQESTAYAEPSVGDYAERTAAQQEWWKAQNGRQGGDPAKLAQALLTLLSAEPTPRRFIAGADAIATAEQKIASLRAEIDAYRDLSTSLGFDPEE